MDNKKDLKKIEVPAVCEDITKGHRVNKTIIRR